MVKIPLKTIYLCVCAVEMLWLLLAQALGNIVLLLPCLACFLVVMAGAALQGIAMPVLLFLNPSQMESPTNNTSFPFKTSGRELPLTPVRLVYSLPLKALFFTIANFPFRSAATNSRTEATSAGTV